MKRNLRERILSLVRIFIGLAAVTYILFKFDLVQMWEKLRLAFKAPIYLGLAGLAFITFLGFRTLRWFLLSRVRRYPYGFLYLYRSILVHHLFNLVLPTTIGGDVYRIIDTSGHHSPEGAFSIIWTGRLCGFVGMFFFAFMGSIIYTMASGNYVMIIILGSGFVFALLVTIGFLSKTINRWLAPRLARIRIFRYRIGEKIADALTYVTFYHDRPFTILGAVLISIAVQTCLAGVWYFTYLSLPQAGKAGFMHFMVTIPLVKTASLFSVGGWGIREVVFPNIMGAFRVSVTQATALANCILFDAVNVLFALVGGAFLLFRRSSRPTASQ